MNENRTGLREQRREQRQQNTRGSCHRQRPPDNRLFLARIAAAKRLRDQSGGAGAQEVEAREHNVEHDRARRQPAQKCCIAQLPHHRGPDQA